MIEKKRHQNTESNARVEKTRVRRQRVRTIGFYCFCLFTSVCCHHHICLPRIQFQMDHLLSSLDLFAQRLDVTQESFDKFVQFINGRLNVVRQEVQILLTRVRARRARTRADSTMKKSMDDVHDQPAVEIVPMAECVKHVQELHLPRANLNAASTLAGMLRNRRVRAQFPNSTTRKRTRTTNPEQNSSSSSKKYACKFEGCEKLFAQDSTLACHVVTMSRAHSSCHQAILVHLARL